MLCPKWKVILFCVSGFILFPLLLRDCMEAPAFHPSKPDSFDREPYYPSYPSPQGTDIIGKWVPDEATAKLLKRDSAHLKDNPASLPHIEFKKDYTFKFTNVPNVFGEEDHGLLFISREGSWNVYQSGAEWKVHLYSDGKENKADLLGTRPPYQSQLLIRREDADGSKTLTFIKLR